MTDADIDAETGELRCKLSDGSVLDVKPAEREAEDDPPKLPGCFAAGDTLDELFESLQEGVAFYLATA